MQPRQRWIGEFTARMIYFYCTGLRIMVNSLLQSLRSMADVVVLMVFFLLLIAIIGLQIFSGVLRRKCILPPADVPYNPSVIAQNSSKL